MQPFHHPILISVLAGVACATPPAMPTTTLTDSVPTTSDRPDEVTPTADTGTAPDTFVLRGIATGVAGTGVVLEHNRLPLTVTEDGEFAFPTPLGDGDSYDVTMTSEPRCPTRTCTLRGASGTVDGADPELVLSCEAPEVLFATVSWGDHTLRLTDDLWSHADGTAATPRTVTSGISAGNGDSVALDGPRDLIYVADQQKVLVYEDLFTLDKGDGPARQFSIKGDGGVEAVALDTAMDRLYVGSETALHVLDAASTLSGEVVPTATLPGYVATSLDWDHARDTLYVAGTHEEHIWMFDTARSMTSSTTPSREIWWDEVFGFRGPGTGGLALDECTDRLYVSSNRDHDGANLVVFDDASALSGEVFFDKDTAARLHGGHQMIAALIDDQDRLYTMTDSADRIYVYEDASAMTGDVSPRPYRILDVVDRGYGMDVLSY